MSIRIPEAEQADQRIHGWQMSGEATGECAASLPRLMPLRIIAFVGAIQGLLLAAETQSSALGRRPFGYSKLRTVTWRASGGD